MVLLGLELNKITLKYRKPDKKEKKMLVNASYDKKIKIKQKEYKRVK